MVAENTGRKPQSMTRRRFLQGMGATLLTLSGGSTLVHFATEAAEIVKKGSQAANHWVMVIDLRRCDGCGKCTKACQEAHHLPEDVEWIKVYELENAAGGTYYLPRPCMQCANAPCLNVCPVGATFESEDGVILVDQDRCIGCRMCMAACPYNARYFNWGEAPEVEPEDLEDKTGPAYPIPQRRGTVGKCVLCVHRLRRAELPGCVEACSMEALYIGDWKTDLMTNGHETVPLTDYLKDNDAFRFKEELNTEPRVYYIAGHGQDLDYYYF